jgi:D-alanine-D-alanine ligase
MEVSKDAVVGVLYGGMSQEREVSLRSGAKVHAALLALGYEKARLIDVSSDSIKEILEIDYAFNTLHGRYGEDGAIQGMLEILKIPYTGPGP